MSYLHCCVIPCFVLGLYQLLQNFFNNRVAILVKRSAYIYFLLARQLQVGKDLLIHEVSR